VANVQIVTLNGQFITKIRNKCNKKEGGEGGEEHHVNHVTFRPVKQFLIRAVEVHRSGTRPQLFSGNLVPLKILIKFYSLGW
jgi:hypothetical protein